MSGVCRRPFCFPRFCFPREVLFYKKKKKEEESKLTELTAHCFGEGIASNKITYFMCMSVLEARCFLSNIS